MKKKELLEKAVEACEEAYMRLAIIGDPRKDDDVFCLLEEVLRVGRPGGKWEKGIDFRR